MSIVVTGAAGFIGFHVCKRLLHLGEDVIGIDNLNDYYDVNLKEARLQVLKKFSNFTFHKEDICNYQNLSRIVGQNKVIIHLAAQAGVRYSLENPFAYVQSNVVGHLNILEICRNIKGFEKLIYASSSSVYGDNKKTPFAVEDKVDDPSSLYAVTKRTDELMSQTYHKLYGINSIGLRFFTVYGEFGRPDMAPFIFTKNVLENKSIKVFNHGRMKRDFTYIDDIVNGVIGALNVKNDGHKIYNLGNSNPVSIEEFIGVLEKITGKKADKNLMPIQKGDVEITYADIEKSSKDLGFYPKVNLEEGLLRTISWYRDFYDI